MLLAVTTLISAVCVYSLVAGSEEIVLNELQEPPQSPCAIKKQKFYVGLALVDWYTARKACTDSGLQLVQIKNEDKWDEVSRYLDENSINYHVWIGLHDLRKDGIWTWDDGSLLVGGYLDHWKNDETRDCAIINFQGRRWDPIACEYHENATDYWSLRFLCETPTAVWNNVDV